MRLTRTYLRKLILEEVGLLLEAEPEEEGAEEEETEEEETEEEGAEEEGAETAPEPEEEEPEEEEPEVHITPEEGVELGKSADDQITAFLVDYESKAIKSASLTRDSELRHDPEGVDVGSIEITEMYDMKLSDLLFEDDASIAGMGQWVGSPDIDIESFTNDVARLIMNYDSLVDMEALIINRAHSYILDKYDQETADYFEELMDARHSMTRETSAKQEEPEHEIYAVGALAQGGGAA